MRLNSFSISSLARVCLNKFSVQNSATFSTSSVQFFPKLEVDGVGINHEVVGNGPHPVLCLPGLMGSFKTDFGQFLTRVDGTKFTWIAWDPPGCGKSRPPDRDFKGPYAFKDAYYAHHLMTKLGFDKYSAFGWSQGGATAMGLAAEFPDNVINFVTLGSGSVSDDRAVRIYGVMADIDFWPKDRLELMLSEYDKPYFKKCLKEHYQTHQKLLKSPQRGEFLTSIADKITCPIIHMHGDEDNACPKSHAHGLKQRIKNSKNSRVIIIPKAGHDLHQTHTKQFLDIVEPFFLNEK